MKEKKIGLALGSGGARGMAHIGVLKVLEDFNIPIDFISGSSMGAVIAALYSAEPNAKKLEKDSLEIEWKKIFDYTFPRSGLIRGERIEKIIRDKLNNIDFKDLKIPLFITAYDLEERQEVIFTRGNVAKAVRASISIPGIFVPVEINNKILVDGGITDPIPTEVLKQAGADIIIAVNVDCIKEKKPLLNQEAVDKKGSKSLPNIIENTSKSFQILTSEACRADLKGRKADFVININLEKIGTMDFKKGADAIKEGEKSARKSLEHIKKLTQNHFRNFLDELQKNLGIKKVVEKIEEKVIENKDKED